MEITMQLLNNLVVAAKLMAWTSIWGMITFWGVKKLVIWTDKTFNTWQARLKREHKQLNKRIAKLQAFLNTDVLSPILENTLKEQLRHMREYRNCLEQRIK